MHLKKIQRNIIFRRKYETLMIKRENQLVSEKLVVENRKCVKKLGFFL